MIPSRVRNPKEILAEAITTVRTAAAGLRLTSEGDLVPISAVHREFSIIAGVFTIRTALMLAQRDEVRLNAELLTAASLLEKEHGQTADAFKERARRV